MRGDRDTRIATRAVLLGRKFRPSCWRDGERRQEIDGHSAPDKRFEALSRRQIQRRRRPVATIRSKV